MNPRSQAPHAHDNGRTPRRSSGLRAVASVLVAFAVAATATATGLSLTGSSSAAITSVSGKDHPSSRTFGSVATAPHVSASFKQTFKDKFVKANGIRQHVVIGGDGPPLLLVHGWPENWYAWRYVMPELAKKFTVIAVDQRGIGLSEKATKGYDTTTLAKDLAALMTELGHERFAVVGHDTGMVISYALAHDFPTGWHGSRWPRFPDRRQRRALRLPSSTTTTMTGCGTSRSTECTTL